jgi:uroporphyrinogen decarboxylase
MTSKERIRATLNHREPDRVPYDLAGTTVTGITKNAYRSVMRYRGLPETFDPNMVDPISQIVTPSEDNLLKLKSDTRRIGAHRIPGYPDCAVRDATSGVEKVIDFYGCEWERNPSADIYFNQTSFPLQDAESLSESLDDLYRVDWSKYVKQLRSDLMRQFSGSETFAVVADRNTAGFTENSLRIRGYEKWYMDTVLDESGVERLLDIILEDKLRYWDEVINWAVENGVADQIDVVAECDDLGSQRATIIHPEKLRILVLPRFKKLFTHVKGRLPNAKTFLHSCGAIRAVIPDLIDAGLDILNPVQYTADGMELQALKKDFGDALVFWGGGIDTQTVLNNGTPAEVRDTVRKTLDILMPGGGFVFAPVHNVQDDVPPENFWAMRDALEEFGSY